MAMTLADWATLKSKQSYQKLNDDRETAGKSLFWAHERNAEVAGQISPTSRKPPTRIHESTSRSFPDQPVEWVSAANSVGAST